MVNDYEQISQAFWDLVNLRDSLRYQDNLPTYIRDMNDVDINNAIVELGKAIHRMQLVGRD